MADNDPYKSPESTLTSETDNPPISDSLYSQYEGLGGWLILVGLGIIVSPIRILTQIVPLYSDIFSNGTFTEISTPSSESYNLSLAVIIISELGINALLLLSWFYVGYLFFAKKRNFPRWYIGILVFTLVFIIIDAIAIKLALPNEIMFDPATMKEIIRSVAGLAIWGSYMIVSKRVKATFVR